MSTPTERPDRGWFKSSRSSSNANCVEVRFTKGEVGIRDSKDPNGAALAFDAEAWSDFLRTFKQADHSSPA